MALSGSSGGAPSVAVVTPTYNERETLPGHVRDVLALGPGYRLVVVDDGSPDGTGAVADTLAAEFPGRVTVVHRPEKLGLGPAYIAGIRIALADRPDLVALMDADRSHTVPDLAALVAAAAACDVALGSRYAPGGEMPGWPRSRRALSLLGGRYAAAVLGLPQRDATSGFRVMTRAALAAIDLDAIRASGYAFNLELTWRAARAGLRIVEVPITFAPREAGESKLTAGIVAEAATLVWRLRLRG